ncbi:MAG: hypothetical protein JNM65_00880 [Verrucomicrobiaceae bacterium]|nr:hypothetical protein [Verrucomicrobiaceae bacterium]
MSACLQNGQRRRHRAAAIHRMCGGLRHTFTGGKFRHDEKLIPRLRADACHLERMPLHVAA